MKIRYLSALTLCLVLGVSTSSQVSADEQPTDPPPVAPVRIMIAGDSISQGFDGDYTWRYRLATEFTRQQVPVDFVGPYRYTYGGSNQYLVPNTGPTAWDSDHDGRGGTKLAVQVAKIGSVVHTYQPDVLIASYGTTDLVHGTTVAQTIAHWRTYITTARAQVAPGHHLKIVLGELMSIRIANRVEMNRAVRVLARSLSTPEDPVIVYDLEHSGWKVAKDSYDGTHPTPTGETVIAQQVAWSLHTLGILPGAPKIWRSFVPWPPPLTPVVRVDHRHLIVNWERAKRIYKTQFMRLRLTSLRSGRSTPTAWTRDLRLRTAKLRPGWYQISVRGQRGTMPSVWGPTISVRIPQR